MTPLSRHAAVRRHAIAVAALTLLAGCGALSPYNHMPVAPAPALTCQPGAASGTCSNGSLARHDDLAGGMGAALAELELRRAEVYQQLDSSAVRRSLGAQTLFGLAGWAAYSGLRPDPTKADSLRATRLAVAASTLYLGTLDSLNQDQESVQARTYNALTCLALQSEPLMWRQGLANNMAQPIEVTDRASLQQALTALQNRVDQGYLARNVALNGYATTGLSPRAKRVVEQLDKALNLARTALREGHELADAIDRSGDLLRYRTAALVGSGNAELQSFQKALPDLGLTTAQLGTLSTSLSTLGKETEAAEKKGKSGDGDNGGDSGSGSTSATPPKVAASSVPAAASSPATESQLSELGAKLTRLLVDAQARARTLVALGPAPAASASTTKSASPVAASGAASAASAPAAASAPTPMLCLDDGDTDPGSRRVCQHRISAHLSSRPESAREKLDGVDSLVTLAEQLHQARRPVMLTLVKFRQAMRTANALEGCGGPSRMVEITPAEPSEVVAGNTASFTVALADGRLPRVGLEGAIQGTAKASVALTVEGSVVVATVTVPADFPEGNITLWATDSQGRNRRQVSIPVKPAPTGKVPQS